MKQNGGNSLRGRLSLFIRIAAAASVFWVRDDKSVSGMGTIDKYGKRSTPALRLLHIPRWVFQPAF
jgi:hypothetical protein